MSSTSLSYSNPQNMYSAQSAAALAIANAAAALGDQTYNWAVQAYNADSAMTSQAVSNYLQMSQQGLAMAQTQMGNYNAIYAPENKELAQLAGTYASTARQQMNAGMAESQSEQGTQQGLTNAKMNLQSYGIDPSSGMYGELEEAQNAGGGAAAAGAGTEASLQTAATGRQLLGESIQVGEQLPGDIVNDLNSAYQGVAGAENATLANTQTGANALDAANPFLSTAMNLRYPPVGNVQRSTSSTQPKQNTTGVGGGPGGGVGPISSTPSQGNYTSPGGSSGGGAKTGGLGAPTGSIAKIINLENGVNNGGNYGVTPSTVNPGASFDQPYNSPNYDPYSAYNTPNNMSEFVDTGPNAMPTDQTFGSSAPMSGIPSGASENGPFQQDPFNSVMGDYSSQNSGGFSTSPGQPSPTDVMPSAPSPAPDQSVFNTGTGSVDYGMGGNYGGYAAGGPVPRMSMTTGGKVPAQASPSSGRQTDDVPARLNVGEFVIPRDTVAWHGQKFFQDLIKKSRQARLGVGGGGAGGSAPAKPTMKAPLPNQNRPTFQSRPMQQPIQHGATQ